MAIDNEVAQAYAGLSNWIHDLPSFREENKRNDAQKQMTAFLNTIAKADMAKQEQIKNQEAEIQRLYQVSVKLFCQQLNITEKQLFSVCAEIIQFKNETKESLSA
jgi:hypothetical protein